MIPRLRPGWKVLGGRSPSSARDVLNSQRLKARSSDLIYSPGYNGGLARSRQLLTLHDLMHLRSEHSPLRARYYNSVIRPIVSHCGAVLTVSKTSQSVIQDWLDDPNVEVLNVGNGLSMTPVTQPPELAWSASRRALYVGNMKPHKNFGTVARAFAAMNAWSLDIVTTDPTEASDAVQAFPGLQERTRIFTRISDRELAEVYSSANVVIMPSTEEGFGLPAIEALAADRRVVYWQGCNAIGEVLGSFGVAVADLQDIPGWQDAVTRAAAMPRPSEEAGFITWLERYNWDDVARRVQAAIDQLAGDEARGGAL